MFEIAVEYSFSAGHALRNYKGKCENVHGHNYRVRVTVEGDKLNGAGLLVDFADLKAGIRSIADGLDHQFLNDIEPFDKLNPSAENIAKHLADGLQARLAAQDVRLQSVTVWETDTSSATYRAPNRSS